MHVTAPATPRELFDLWAAVHPKDLPAPALVRHPLVEARLRHFAQTAPDLFHVEEVGRSVEGRSLQLVRLGTGPRHILLWSQMHGDEPTATTALFDLLEYVRLHRDEPRVRRLLSALTLHALPMLNPDGAERFQRRNAQGIDINRDALALQTPEGRTLKGVRDRLQPSLGFNLHNQSWRTAVGGTGRPASISLLAPPFDAARNDNPGRVLAKKVCAVIRDALEPLASGQLGRYDDSFEMRAFGDNLVRWGTPTVLIETGPWPSPQPDEPLLRLNFVALVTALEARRRRRHHRVLQRLLVSRVDDFTGDDGRALCQCAGSQQHQHQDTPSTRETNERRQRWCPLLWSWGLPLPQFREGRKINTRSE